MNDTEFRPTHVAPLEGLPTWSSPDPSRPSAWLDPLLPVQLVGHQGDWGQITCANGWSAWVDGRLLIALPDGPPGATNPLARSTDPRPLLARLEEAVTAYRQLVEQLVDRRIDLEEFQRRSEGFRLGIVVDGESAWLLDLDHDRWWYCRGTQLQTFATVVAPPDVRGASGSDDSGSGDDGSDEAPVPLTVTSPAAPRQAGDG
jgi:hypothetical protein